MVKGFSPGPRAATAAVVLLSAVPAIGSWWVMGRGLDSVLAHQVLDDSFYYLQVAWNLEHTGVPTFDGVHRTSGFHPLWLLLLLPLASLSSTKLSFLYVALSACVVVAALSFVVLARWARAGQGVRSTALLSGVFWAALLADPGQFLVKGMETAVHALVLGWTVEALFRLHQARHTGASELGPTVWLTLALSLGVLARLDSVLISAVIYARVAVWALSVEAPRRKTALLELGKATAIAAAATVLTAGFYLWVDGRPYSVTALMKAGAFTQKVGASEYLEALRVVLERAMPTRWLIARALEDGVVRDIAGIALVLLVILVATWPRRRSEDSHADPVAGFRFALRWVWVGVLVHAVWTARLGLHVRYAIWYYGPLLFVSCVTLGVLASDLYRFVERKLRGRGAALRALVPGVALFCIALVAAQARRTLALQPTEGGTEHAIGGHRAAEWIDRHLPPGAVVGSFNAGALGFFSRHRVVNLDGLANSFSFYNEVLQGPTDALPSYLRREGIHHIADSEVPDDLLPHLEPIAAVPTPMGRSQFQLLRVRRPE